MYVANLQVLLKEEELAQCKKELEEKSETFRSGSSLLEDIEHKLRSIQEEK